MLRTTLQVISTFLLKGTLCRFLKKLIATSLVCLQTHWAVLTPGQPLLPGDSLQVPVRAATDEPKSFVLFVCSVFDVECTHFVLQRAGPAATEKQKV